MLIHSANGILKSEFEVRAAGMQIRAFNFGVIGCTPI